jgi:predicted oxidoreductase
MGFGRSRVAMVREAQPFVLASLGFSFLVLALNFVRDNKSLSSIEIRSYRLFIIFLIRTSYCSNLQMSRLVSAGFTSFDGADHYGSAELLMGELRKWYLAENGADKGHELQLFTKWVPPAEDTPFTRVQSAVDRSLQRMGVKCIDILQFHWWGLLKLNYVAELLALMHACRL